MKKFKKDIVIVAVLLTLASAFFIFNKLTADNGKNVIIYVDEKFFAEYSLSKDDTYEINTKYGTNIVKIEKGQVFIHNASCSNQICVKHKPISKSNESIICLPNHLVVRIEGKTNDGIKGEIDDVAK